MPVRAFPADFGFHFRRTGTMQAGDIGRFFLALVLILFSSLGFSFLPLKTIPPIIASSILTLLMY